MQVPLKTDPTQCPLNIPIDHQGLIARVRSALVDSQDHEIQMEPPLPILSPETSLIIQQSAEPQMIIQHADGMEPLHDLPARRIVRRTGSHPTWRRRRASELCSGTVRNPRNR